MRLLSLVLLLHLCLTPAAAAQGRGSFVNLLKPPLDKTEYARVLDMIGLAEDQREAADALYDGLLASHQPRAERLRELYEARERAIRDKKPVAELTRSFDTAFEEYVRAKDSALFALVRDLQTLLTQDQVGSSWPPAERFIRRRLLSRLSRKAVSLWHRVDLCSVVGAVTGSERPEAARSILQEYEVGLDNHLARLQHALWTKAGEWRSLSDEEFVRVSQDIGDAVALHNQRYARWTASVLPAAQASRLNESVEDQAYPALAIAREVDRKMTNVFARVARVADLEETQRSKLDAVQRQWRAQLRQICDRVDAETRRIDSVTRLMTDAEWVEFCANASNDAARLHQDTVSRVLGAQHDTETAVKGLLSGSQQRAVWPDRDEDD